MPDKFEIGRLTFFDFGPPFDYYEIFLVRSAPRGSSVERILLTPPGDFCLQAAKLEVSSGAVPETVEQLLEGRNPCSISDKELTKESKRKKKGLVFSGSIVNMSVECGAANKVIHTDVLDRDWFDPNAHTPAHTSWTARVLAALDRATGPGVIQKPIFADLPGATAAEEVHSNITPQDVQGLRAGKYDSLFPSSGDKPSELYLATQRAPIDPSVRLASSTPIQPERFIAPAYPPLAKQARVEGDVVVRVDVRADGSPENISIESGHPLLKATVLESAKSWVFAKGADDRQVLATIEFRTNCPKDKH